MGRRKTETEEDLVLVTFRIPRTLRESFFSIAAKQGTSATYLVREYMQDAVEFDEMKAGHEQKDCV